MLPKQYKIELIYRESEDGFASSDCNKKCDDKGTVLIIIKSEHQKIFGAYYRYS